MAEPKQIIKNIKGEPLGYSKFGVFWDTEGKIKVGHFHDSKIYNSAGNEVGTLIGYEVLNNITECVGHIEAHQSAGYKLFSSSSLIGFFQGSDNLAAAAGLLLFHEQLI